MERFRVADYFRVPELPVAVWAMRDQNPLLLHRHEFAELTMISGGTALHLTAHGKYAIAAGDVFYVQPEQPHGFAQVRGLSLVNGLFLPASMGAMSAEVQALFTQLVVRLARSYGAHASAAGRRLLAVQQTIRELEDNVAKPVELRALAKRAGMSLSTFKRAFENVTGTSPINYLLQVRLARACHLMRMSHVTITEAALGAGFGDSNYFARQFRRRMGCTPRAWREQQRGDVIRRAS